MAKKQNLKAKDLINLLNRKKSKDQLWFSIYHGSGQIVVKDKRNQRETAKVKARHVPFTLKNRIGIEDMGVGDVHTDLNMNAHPESTAYKLLDCLNPEEEITFDYSLSMIKKMFDDNRKPLIHVEIWIRSARRPQNSIYICQLGWLYTSKE